MVNVQRPSRQSSGGCNTGRANLAGHRHLSIQSLHRNGLLLSAPSHDMYLISVHIHLEKETVDTTYCDLEND